MGITAKYEIPQSLRNPDNITKSPSAPMDPQVQEKNSFGTPTVISTKVVEPNEEPPPPDPLLTRITFEDILEKLGCFGPFQVLTLFLYLLLEIACSFMVFIPVLVGRATIPENCTNEGENGTFTWIATTEASYFEYSTEGGNQDTIQTTESATLTSVVGFSVKSFMDSFQEMLENPFQYESLADEWDLKCDRSWVPDVFTSCLMAGMIFGNILASQMADWYGRRRTYIMILIFMAIGTTLSAMSPSIYFYAFARFLSGGAFCGFINCSCMAVMEFMTPNWRSVANCVGPMGEGIMLLALLGYFIRPWRLLYLATLTPYLFIIPVYLFLPESPRWLLRNKRMQEAHQVLGYMAKINRREPISMDVLEALRKQEELTTVSQSQKRVGYLDFIKNRTLLKTSLYLCAIWFSWNVAYYGISYNIRNVPGDPYVNLALVGLANAIGQRASFVVCDWLGRRRAVLASMSFSASFLVTLAICFLAFHTVNHYLILVGCFCGLMGLASCRASARLLSGESFPTAVRTMGLGFGGLGANVAGLLTPQLVYLGSRWPAFPFFVFAGVAVAGSLVVFMMAETNGNPLSDEIQSSGDKKTKSKKGEV